MAVAFVQGPGTITPQSATTNVVSMGDGRSAIVLAADVDKVYVFKLPFTGMP